MNGKECSARDRCEHSARFSSRVAFVACNLHAEIRSALADATLCLLAAALARSFVCPLAGCACALRKNTAPCHRQTFVLRITTWTDYHSR